MYKKITEDGVQYAFNTVLRVPELKVGCEQLSEKDLIELAEKEKDEKLC